MHKPVVPMVEGEVEIVEHLASSQPCPALLLENEEKPLELLVVAMKPPNIELE